MIRSALNHIIDFIAVVLILAALGALFFIQIIFICIGLIASAGSNVIEKAVGKIEFVWKLSSESGDTLWFWFGKPYRFFQKTFVMISSILKRKE